jgi:hypothetical protein
VGIRCADHITPSTRKSRHYFADSGGRSVGIVRLRTKATESRPGRSLLRRSESVILLVDNLYAEAIRAVKLQTALSASSPKLIKF